MQLNTEPPECLYGNGVEILFPSQQAQDRGVIEEEIMRRTPVAVYYQGRCMTSLSTHQRVILGGQGGMDDLLGASAFNHRNVHCLSLKSMGEALDFLAENFPQIKLREQAFYEGDLMAFKPYQSSN